MGQHAVEDVAALPHVQVGGIREITEVIRFVPIAAEDGDHLVDAARPRLQQERVDHRKHCRVHADAERQHAHSDGGEPGLGDLRSAPPVPEHRTHPERPKGLAVRVAPGHDRAGAGGRRHAERPVGARPQRRERVVDERRRPSEAECQGHPGQAQLVDGEVDPR